jgi:hypothetical protein
MIPANPLLSLHQSGKITIRKSLRFGLLLMIAGMFDLTQPAYAQHSDNSRYMIDSALTYMERFDSSAHSTHQQVYPYSRKKVTTMAIANVGIYTASMTGLYAAWYKNYPQGKFHVFNDIGEWNQVDKVGHVYSAYSMGRYSIELWRYTGIDRKKRIWIGGISGAVYQTVIEVLDGFSTEWGWSWGDIGANLLGSASLVAQELAWDEQRIQIKTSFHRKNYNDPALNQRSNILFGKSSPERFLKDYNGQTYWLSTSIRSFFPKSRWPSWLQVSVGYGAEGMFGARENTGKDENGNINFYRPDIQRYRQWYLSPDIDLTKIKTKKKLVKYALFVLNSLKFPAPGIEYSRNKFRFHWISF